MGPDYAPRRGRERDEGYFYGLWHVVAGFGLLAIFAGDGGAESEPAAGWLGWGNFHREGKYGRYGRMEIIDA